MPILTLQIIFAISIFILILLAGAYPFKHKLNTSHAHKDFPIGETLATGIFLGAALMHMLPEAQNSFITLNVYYPYAYAITGVVFLIFLWLEHIGKELYHHNASHPAFAILAWAMLSFHSLILGTALGLSHEYPMLFMIFFATITHKWAESLAISIQLNKSSLPVKISVILFLIFALMSPLGIIIGYNFGSILNKNSLLSPIMMSISAGTFLYLGTLHGLERCVLVEKCCNLRDFSFVILGFVIMSIVCFF